MAALQCEICGGKLIGKPGGIFVCDSCGVEYDTSWAKAKVQEIKGKVQIEGPVEVTGKVQIDGSFRGNNIESLLIRGSNALKKGRWKEAYDFFDQVLNQDAKNVDAYLGKSMANRMCSTKESFIQKYVNGEIQNDTNFEYVREYADDALRKKIIELDQIRDANVKRHREEMARLKEALMESISVEENKIKNKSREDGQRVQAPQNPSLDFALRNEMNSNRTLRGNASILSENDYQQLERGTHSREVRSEHIHLLQQEVEIQEEHLLSQYRVLIRQCLDEIKDYAKNHQAPHDIVIVYRRFREGRGYEYSVSGYWIGAISLYQCDYAVSSHLYSREGGIFFSKEGKLIHVAKDAISERNGNEPIYIPNCKIVKTRDSKLGFAYKGGDRKLEFSDIDGVTSAIAFTACEHIDYKYGKTMDIKDADTLKMKRKMISMFQSSIQSDVKQYLINVLSGKHGPHSFFVPQKVIIL